MLLPVATRLRVEGVRCDDRGNVEEIIVRSADDPQVTVEVPDLKTTVVSSIEDRLRPPISDDDILANENLFRSPSFWRSVGEDDTEGALLADIDALIASGLVGPEMREFAQNRLAFRRNLRAQ